MAVLTTLSSQHESGQSMPTSATPIPAVASSTASNHRVKQVRAQPSRTTPSNGTAMSAQGEPSQSQPTIMVVNERNDKKRPSYLPPVEARETIRLQAAKIRTWQPIDGSDEIIGAAQIDIGRANPALPTTTCLGESKGASTIGAKPALQSTPTATQLTTFTTSFASSAQVIPPQGFSLPTTNTSGTPASTPSSPSLQSEIPSTYPRSTSSPIDIKPTQQSHKHLAEDASEAPPKKKRRLLMTHKAIEICNKTPHVCGFANDGSNAFDNGTAVSKYGVQNPFPDGFPIPDNCPWLNPDDHPGSALYQDELHEDERYHSQLVDAAEMSGAESEKDQRCLQLLAGSHCTSVANPDKSKLATAKPASNMTAVERENMKADGRMAEEQEAGVRRSRKLREAALRRRRMQEVPWAKSNIEREKRFHGNGAPNDDSMSDLFSDKDDDEYMTGTKANATISQERSGSNSMAFRPGNRQQQR
jgi:hypothetical protein